MIAIHTSFFITLINLDLAVFVQFLFFHLTSHNQTNSIKSIKYLCVFSEKMFPKKGDEMIKFPWTKQIEELEKLVSDNAEHVHTFNSNYHDIFNGHILRIEKLEKELSEVHELADRMNSYIDDYFEGLSTRLGKAELMHAATSKKQNELFDNAMSSMIDAYSRFSIHISTLAEQKIKEISDFIGIPDLKKKCVLISINSQPETVYSNEIPYEDILERFFYHFPNKKGPDFSYSITYTDGGDEGNQSGTMAEKGVLVIKPGTVVNVLVIDAIGS